MDNYSVVIHKRSFYTLLVKPNWKLYLALFHLQIHLLDDLVNIKYFGA